MVSNTAEVKQLNVEHVRRAAQRHRICTKSIIADETQLSIATCGTILNEMIRSGEIVKMDQKDTIIGRPAGLFEYNGNYQHILCICLGFENGTVTVRCSVANALGDVITEKTSTAKRLNFKTLEKIVDSFFLEYRKIVAIGVGVPGVVREGKVGICAIKSLEQTDIAGLLNSKFGVEVLVENDMDFIVYSLHQKQSGPAGDLAVIYFPKGSRACVGCGFVIDGRIHHGATMVSGELAYVISGFGIVRSKQQKMLEDRTLFHQLAAQILLTVIGTVNPQSTAFMGNNIDQDDLEGIKKACRRIVPEEHIPLLTVDNDILGNYQNGGIRLLLDTIQYRHTTRR